MKWNLLFIFAIVFLKINAQIVYIPDTVFKAFLVNEPSININNDNEIQQNEASSVENLEVVNLGIYSLIGIEAFNNLKLLNCSRNNLQSLDVSNNTSLETLRCSDNALIQLNLDSNASLKHLDCTRIEVDTLSLEFNTNLLSLKTGGDFLEHIGIQNNTNLISIELRSSMITTLDFTQNPNLNSITINGSNYTSLSVHNNQNLSKLFVFNTSIDSLSLDLNPNLNFVNIRSNDNLNYLSVKNNNNSLLSTFNSQNNSALLCIGIDNIVYSSMQEDIWTEFNTNCPARNCKSYSIQNLPSICLYGSDTPNDNTKIDTITNHLGCDSFVIRNYEVLNDISYQFDSIFLTDSSGYLRPNIAYQVSQWGGPYEGPYFSLFTKDFFDFQWYLNNDTIIGAIDSVHIPIATGYYHVELSLKGVNNLCKLNSQAFLITIPTAVSNTSQNSLKVYPNPFEDFITVTTKNLEEFEVCIYSLWGTLLFKENAVNNQRIDLNEFASGIYFIQLQSDDNKEPFYKGKVVKR